MIPPDITEIQFDLTSWQGVVALGIVLLAFIIMPAYFNYHTSRAMKESKEIEKVSYADTLARIERKLDTLDGRVAFLESSYTDVTRSGSE